MDTVSEAILGIDLALKEVNKLVKAYSLIGLEREAHDKLQLLRRIRTALLDVRYSLYRMMKASGRAGRLNVRDKMEIAALIAAIFRATELFF